METVTKSAEYRRLGRKVIKERDDLKHIRLFGIKVGYLASDLEKKSKGRLVYGECRLVPKWARPYCPHDFEIIIYENNVGHLDEKQMEILMWHELKHIDVPNPKNGEQRIRPHDIEDFQIILEKYGLDWSD